MSNAVNNPFAGRVRDAQVFENGAYLSPDGHFVLEIERVLVKTSRQKKELFIAEMRVLESNKAEDPVGSKRSWCQDMNADGAFGEIKKFVYATLGLEWSRDKEKIKAEIDPKIEAILFEAIGATNPLKGVKVVCDTQSKLTKAGKPFTRHDFQAYTA